MPTLWLAWAMWQAHWIMPVDLKRANRPQPSTVLLVAFWAATLVYNVFQGLYYGIRSALFMDITTPAVAATQFTAYMAMVNLCISYTAWWQGYAIERIGYPATLLADSLLGLVGLLLLPLMKPPARGPAKGAGAGADATGRAPGRFPARDRSAVRPPVDDRAARRGEPHPARLAGGDRLTVRRPRSQLTRPP